MKNNLIDKFFHFFNSKKVIFIISLCIVLIVFHKLIEEWLTEGIVKTLLAKVESVWYNDLIFYLSLVFIIVHAFYKAEKKFTPSKGSTTFFFIIALLYIYYRYYREIWQFTPLSSFPEFKYVDLVILIPLINYFLFITEVGGLSKNFFNSFREDEPVGFKKTDELGYEKYAKNLAEKIEISHFENAFAIGINGKWGIGKTSFINLVKQALVNTQFIEVNFNPWNSNNPKAIIQDFFETIQISIKPYHSSLSRLFLSYSNKLVSINDNAATRSIYESISELSDSESLSKLFEEINQSLKRINRKILIFIDDLDRLDSGEIVEVIRLIRNTANFYNTFFIVAYDKNYVNNALKKHSTYNHGQFLEKIFQLEITLPHFNKEILRAHLSKTLKESFDSKHHSIIEQEVNGNLRVQPSYLNEWIDTMRDVTRLSNALILNLKDLIGEVDFLDSLRLELLRVKYPSVYFLLFQRTRDFLETTQSGNEDFVYRLKLDKPDSRSNQGNKTKLEQFITRNCNELSVPEEDVQKIIDLIDSLFNSSRSLGTLSRSHLSIIYPSKFFRYFTFDLNGSLSEVIFSNSRSLGQNEFNTQIEKWVDAGLEFEVQERFKRILSFDNKTDFEKVIKAIFHLGTLKTQKINFGLRDYVGYDGKDLLIKLNNIDQRIEKKFYPNFNGNGYRTFVKSIFDDAKSPYLFESDIARLIVKDFSDDFGLSKIDFELVLVSYLERYCQIKQKLDSNVWRLFHNSIRIAKTDVGNGSYTVDEIPLERAKEVFINLIKDDLDEFLITMISPETFRKETFGISDFALKLFQNWAGFKDFLNSMDDSSFLYLKEFKDFFNEFEKVNFARYVHFNFRDIPIQIRKDEIVSGETGILN